MAEVEYSYRVSLTTRTGLTNHFDSGGKGNWDVDRYYDATQVKNYVKRLMFAESFKPQLKWVAKGEDYW